MVRPRRRAVVVVVVVFIVLVGFTDPAGAQDGSDRVAQEETPSSQPPPLDPLDPLESDGGSGNSSLPAVLVIGLMLSLAVAVGGVALILVLRSRSAD